MSKLRIAIYHNLHSGGAKRVVEEQIYRLAPRHWIELFSMSGADQGFASRCGGAVTAELVPFRTSQPARSPFGRLNPLIRMADSVRLDALSRRVAARIDQAGFDVVLVHPCQFTQAPLLLRWLRTPSLYVCQELPRQLYEPPVPRPIAGRARLRQALDRIDPLLASSRALLRYLDRKAAWKAACIVVNSAFSRSNVVRAYGRDAQVCYPGVDAEVFAGTAVRERFVLSVGALMPAKGFDFVISALASLPAASRPPLVLISNYQEPRELSYLGDLARKCGVTLQCHAGVSEAELRTWYARAGCVAYAPVREPLGLVALEAMAAGAAIVGVAEGGVRETIVDGVTGVLAPRVAATFAAAIERLLLDPVYASELGLAARRHVLERWTWHAHIEQLERLLEMTVAVRRPGGKVTLSVGH